MRYTEEALVEAVAPTLDIAEVDIGDLPLRAKVADAAHDIVVEIGGTQVSGIDVGEDYNKKWQSPIGTRKYNKDAFIVIKNKSRDPFQPSQPNPDLKAHHAES